MLVINLFGAPGAGKSTGAAYLFSRLKMAGVNAELVTEFAKDKVWEGSNTVFQNQAYIFGKQYFRISRLENKVDVVVTDSPIILGSFYNRDQRIAPELNALSLKVFNSYDNYNVYINRVKDYNPKGRLQNELESDILAEKMSRFLDSCEIKCLHYTGDEEGYEALTADVLDMLKERDNT